MECYISTVVFATYLEDSKEVFFKPPSGISFCNFKKKKKKLWRGARKKPKNNPLELDTDLASNPDFQWALASLAWLLPMSMGALLLVTTVIIAYS